VGVGANLQRERLIADELNTTIGCAVSPTHGVTS
jgi:hypothetical protein